MSTHNLCFEQKYEKYRNFYLKISFFGGKIFSTFEYACFGNVRGLDIPLVDFYPFLYPTTR